MDGTRGRFRLSQNHERSDVIRGNLAEGSRRGGQGTEESVRIENGIEGEEFAVGSR